jgi:hypothetical protein
MARKWKNQSLTRAAAREGITLETPGMYILRAGRAEVLVHLQIDPADPRTEDDRYTLFASTDRALYATTLTPKDDTEPGDHLITLRFGELPEDPALCYSLEVDPGADGEPYLVFEELPYTDLIEEESDAGSDAGAQGGTSDG